MFELIPLFDIVDLTIKFLYMCGACVIGGITILWLCTRG